MLPGEYLMSLRIDRGISLRELGKKTGIDYITIAEIEKGINYGTEEELQQIFEGLKFSDEEKEKFYLMQNQEKNTVKNNYSMYKKLKVFIKNLTPIKKNILRANIGAGFILACIAYKTESVSITVYSAYLLFVLNIIFFLLKKTREIESKKISYKDEKEFRELGDQKEYRELQNKKEKMVDKALNYAVAIMTSGIFINSKIVLKLLKENLLLVVIIFFIIEVLSITGFDFYMNDIDIFEKKLGLKNKFRNIPFISSLRGFGYQILTFLTIVFIYGAIVGIIEGDKQIKEKKLFEELNSLDEQDREKVLKFINDYIKN